MHDNVIFGLQNLGIWGALQASHILLSGDHSERHELLEADGNSSDESRCDKYLAQAVELFTSQCMTGSERASQALSAGSPSFLAYGVYPIYSASWNYYYIFISYKCLVFN
ncbi:hypothetical protein D0Y65_034473 [Glycine soja]|uniref:Uncharacterized protein n=1 Tax=Glycine soja TaxID=3848 RepID=A0A445HQN4_GLYSO|nr:hypothetical protein D0Y65_034473 [Glycine soja]